MPRTDKVIIISGATCTGKTDASIMLAKYHPEINFEIINFDSLLFYKDINIGTAKPTDNELKEIKHHLVNINSIDNEINASDFVELAQETMLSLLDKEITPILVGGSTFYLRALLKGMYESESTDDTIRNHFDKIYKDDGIAPIITYLKNHDKESLVQIHENDHYRLIRACEYHKQTGNKISLQKKSFDQMNPYDFSENQFKNIDFHHINLTIEKDQHWSLMESRAQKMIDLGLIDEVKELLSSKYSGKEKPLQSIGYKETIQFINGEIVSKEELIERIYINTRRLAKSQKTFLNKVTPKVTFNYLQQKQEISDSARRFLSE